MPFYEDQLAVLELRIERNESAFDADESLGASAPGATGAGMGGGAAAAAPGGGPTRRTDDNVLDDSSSDEEGEASEDELVGVPGGAPAGRGGAAARPKRSAFPSAADVERMTEALIEKSFILDLSLPKSKGGIEMATGALVDCCFLAGFNRPVMAYLQHPVHAACAERLFAARHTAKVTVCALDPWTNKQVALWVRDATHSCAQHSGLYADASTFVMPATIPTHRRHGIFVFLDAVPRKLPPPVVCAMPGSHLVPGVRLSLSHRLLSLLCRSEPDCPTTPAN